MLTNKQLELLRFLEEKISNFGVSPSFEEMKHALGLRSKSGIHRLICALEERGFLKKLPHRARSIEIIRSTSSFLKEQTSQKGSEGVENISTHLDSQEIRSVPLVGKIAAGTPIEAIANASEMIKLPESMLGKGSYFALNVTGDSMKEIGINEGDVAIIEKKNEANSGDLVVALIDETEATLKRFKKIKDKVILESENKDYPPQVYEKDTKVRIQGILSGIIRKYR